MGPQGRRSLKASAIQARSIVGGRTATGRIYYGPGRYDYGRVKMPKGWISNFFYGQWEFFHLMFVVDRWTFIRQLRHFFGIAMCFLPFKIQMDWNVQSWQEYKDWYAKQGLSLP